VYYVNYAHARIHSVFAKVGKTFADVTATELSGLDHDSKELLFTAMLLPEAIDDAYHTRNVSIMTDYLYKLASTFHRFYNANRVMGSDNEAQYLKIFAVVAQSLKLGLNLLGITAKERMEREED